MGTCTNAAVNTALNTGTLAPGAYTEYITLTDPNAIDSPQDIPVTVDTAAGVPSSITAYVMPYGSTASGAMFPVMTAGTGMQVAITTQTGGNWLQFLENAPWNIQVESFIGEAPGAYIGRVVISGSSSASDNQTIAVTQVVTNGPHPLPE